MFLFFKMKMASYHIAVWILNERRPRINAAIESRKMEWLPRRLIEYIRHAEELSLALHFSKERYEVFGDWPT